MQCRAGRDGSGSGSGSADDGAPRCLRALAVVRSTASSTTKPCRGPLLTCLLPSPRPLCRPLSLHAERLSRLVHLWRSGALDFDSTLLHAANHHNEFASVY